LATVEEQALAEEVLQAKDDWERAHAAGDQASMDAAHARAENARDRLRGMGRDDIADGMDADDTRSSAGRVYDALTGGSASRAPTAGGTTKQDDELAHTQSGSGYTPSGPKTVKNGGGSGSKAPSSNDLAGKVTKGVTDFLSGILGNLNTGVKAGAQGTGAAAGGLAETFAQVGGVLAKVAMPVLLVWGAVKIFRIALKVGK
jgi:hypothetical protein